MFRRIPLGLRHFYKLSKWFLANHVIVRNYRRGVARRFIGIVIISVIMLFPGCISGDPAPIDPNPLDNSPPSCCNPTSENFVTHDSEDEDAYQEKLEDWLDENDEDDMVTLESNQVHFMYSSVETDFKQIILQMNLSEEEVLLITFYDNEWHMFPDEIEIKAGQGYFVITLYGDVNSFGLTTSEVEYGGNMMTLTNGWNLIAFNDDFSQSTGISNIWKIKDWKVIS